LAKTSWYIGVFYSAKLVNGCVWGGYGVFDASESGPQDSVMEDNMRVVEDHSREKWEGSKEGR